MQTCAHINGGKDILPHLMFQAQMTGNDIREPSHIFYNGDRNKCLGGNLVRELHPFLKFTCHTVNKCLHIFCLRYIRVLLLNHIDLRLRIGLTLTNGEDLCTLLPINQNPQDTFRHPQKLTNFGNCADIIKICSSWFVKLRFLL